MASQEYITGILRQLQEILGTSGFADASRSLSGDSLLVQIEDSFERTASADVEDLISIAFLIEQIAIRLWTEDEYG
ncbi:MAG: hypothetical protein DRI79_13545, partial [Chloroflexi bacterium]